MQVLCQRAIGQKCRLKGQESLLRRELTERGLLGVAGKVGSGLLEAWEGRIERGPHGVHGPRGHYTLACTSNFT